MGTKYMSNNPRRTTRAFKKLLLAEISVDKNASGTSIQEYSNMLDKVSVDKGTDTLIQLGVRTHFLTSRSALAMCSSHEHPRYKVYRFVGDVLPSGNNDMIQPKIIRGFEDISHNDFASLKKFTLLKEVMGLLDAPSVHCVRCVPYGGLKTSCFLCEVGRKDYYLNVMAVVCICIKNNIINTGDISKVINSRSSLNMIKRVINNESKK